MNTNLLVPCMCLIILGCDNPEINVKPVVMGERAYHSICWLTWGDSELPVIENLPNKRFWNDSIMAFEAHVMSANFGPSETSFCCGIPCKDDESIAFPQNEGLVGSFRYQLLSNTAEVISLMLHCNVHYSGGNLDWNELLVLNINPKTGDPISFPKELEDIVESTLDSNIRSCISSDACSPTYYSYNHSEYFPNFLRDAISEKRIGFYENEWVVCMDYNPYTWCSAMAQTVCLVPLGSHGAFQ